MSISTYAEALAKLNGRSSRKLANNTYLHVRETTPTSIAVQFHNTDVITYYPDGRVTLNSGGWKTVTTKDRINTYAPTALWLAQKAGVWYLSRNGGAVFQDGVTLDTKTGKITGAAKPAASRAIIKLRARVRKYAAAFVDALFAVKVPAPSNGDCWGCLMVTKDGKAPMGGADHILSHLDENYYVPSLLVRALERPGAACDITRGVVGEIWRGTPATRGLAWTDVARRDCIKAIVRYCYHELGLVN